MISDSESATINKINARDFFSFAMLLLSESEVQTLLAPDNAISLVEDAFAEFSKGTAVIPQRISLTKPSQGMTLVMLGILGSQKILGTKIVSVYPQNPSLFNLPTILAKVILQDFDTGKIIAMIDANDLTKIRTGAATAVSVKYLARKNSKIIGLFGAGTQAEGQLLSICSLNEFKFDSCKIYDPNMKTAQNFKKKMESLCNVEVIVEKDTMDFVNNCDIVICASTAIRPLFNGNDLKEGTHVCSIGSHSPGTRELDSFTLARASIIAADSKEACLNEAGDFIIPINEGLLNPSRILSIGDIITGKHPARVSDDQITAFKSVGIAIQDLVCANYVYKKAIKNQVGLNINQL
mgnify:CR=1 FL=1